MTIVYGPQPTKEQQKAYDKARRKRKILRVLKETAGTMSGAGPDKPAGSDKPVDRASQFRMYMDTIDKLKSTRVRLPGRIELGNLTARSGKVGSAKTTNMSAIMDKYHDKALRMAQAKYYQKQLS